MGFNMGYNKGPIRSHRHKAKGFLRWILGCSYFPIQASEFDRKPSTPRKAKPRPRSLSALTELDVYANTDNIPLPTPEEKLREMSRSQPVTLVPIDTSGSGFNRLCEYRSSIRASSREYLDEGMSTRQRKKRRRLTVSGIPGLVVSEVHGSNSSFKVSNTEPKLRNVSRERWERPRSMAALEYYAPRTDRGRSRRDRFRDPDDDPEESNLARSCSLRRSLKSLFKGSRSKSGDLWVRGRPVSPGPPVVDLSVNPGNLRRSRSLPRSLKAAFKNSLSKLTPSRSASTEGRLDSVHDEEPEQLFTETDLYNHLSADVEPPHVTHVVKRKSSRGAKAKLQRLSRSRSHHGNLGCSTFQEADNRPKSLEISPGTLQQHRHAIPVQTPITPSTESLSSSITQGSSSTSSHMPLNIPPGQPPWAPFANVRLRNSKGALDDRQSSSGNWSGSSSSARQSLESDYAKSVSSPDKDSALSLNMNVHDDKYNTSTDNNGEDTSTLGDTSTVNGDTSTLLDDTSSTLNGSVVNVKTNFTKMNTDDWLKSLTRNKGSKKHRSSSSSQANHKRHSTGSTSSMESLYRQGRKSESLTLQNLLAHEANLPYRKNVLRLGDDESSVYSVDQEGFYTSMHKDSGLSRSHADIISEVDNSDSVHNYHAMTMDSALKKKSREKRIKRGKSLLNKLKSSPDYVPNGDVNMGKKRTPPPPPPRVSTVADKNNLNAPGLTRATNNKLLSSTTSMNSSDSTQSSVPSSKKLGPPSILDESVVTESDTEAICARLRVKTNICSAGIPMMVSITPCGSDEEDLDMLNYSSAWRDQLLETKENTVDTSPSPASSTVITVPVNVAPTFHLALPKRMESILENSQDDIHPSMSDRSMDDMSLPPPQSMMDQSLDMSLEWNDIDGFSTWPRSPRSPTNLARQRQQRESKLETILSKDSVDVKTHTTPPKSIKFNPVTPNAQKSLPSPKTPDDSLGKSRTFTSFPSSFRDQSAPKTKVPVLPPKRTDSLNSGAKSHVYAQIQVAQSKSAEESAYAIPRSLQIASTVQNKDSRKTLQSSTWPRHKTPPTSPERKPSFPEVQNSPEQDSFSTNTFPRKVDRNHITGNRKVSPPKTLDLANATPALPMPEPMAIITSPNIISPTIFAPAYSTPVAASARLIISSPVASRAEYVENPHKRSLCSPVTEQDLNMYSQYSTEDKWYNALPRGATSPFDPNRSFGNAEVVAEPQQSPTAFEFGKSTSKPVFNFQLPVSPDSAFKPISSPLFPDLGSMKHSISFPIPEKKKVNPSNYGRSWYEGIKKDSTSTPHVTQTSIPFTKSALSNPKENTANSYTPGARRGSNASSISTTSSSSGKKSVTFASIHKSSMSSLNKSDVGSISSGHSGDDHNAVSDHQVAEDLNDDHGSPKLKRSVSTVSGISQTSTSSNSSQLTSTSEESNTGTIQPEPSPKKQKTATNVIKAANTKHRPRLIGHGHRQKSGLIQNNSNVSSIPEHQMWTNHIDAYKSVVTSPTAVKPVQAIITAAAMQDDGKTVVNVAEGKAVTKPKENKIIITATKKPMSSFEPSKPSVKVNLQNATSSASTTPNGTLERVKKEPVSTSLSSSVSSTLPAAISTPIATVTCNSGQASSILSESKVPNRSLSSSKTTSTFKIAMPKPVVAKSAFAPLLNSATIASTTPAAIAVTNPSVSVVSSPSFTAVSTTALNSFTTNSTPQLVKTNPTPPKFVLPTLRSYPRTSIGATTSNSNVVSKAVVIMPTTCKPPTKPKKTGIISSSVVQPSTTTSFVASRITRPSGNVTTSTATPVSATYSVTSSSTPTMPAMVVSLSPVTTVSVVKGIVASPVVMSTVSSVSVIPSGVRPASDMKVPIVKSNVNEGGNKYCNGIEEEIHRVKPNKTGEPVKNDKNSGDRDNKSEPHRPVLGRSTSLYSCPPESPTFGRFSLSGSSTSLNHVGYGSCLLRSPGSNFAKSLNNLTGMSLPGNNLGCSMSSLANSNDSISSNSSVNAERNRQVKLAFLESQNAPVKKISKDPFSKYSLGQKKLSASRTSLSSVKESFVQEKIETKFSEQDSKPPSGNTSPRVKSAVQGRFVSSLINRFQDNKSDSSNSLSSSNHSSCPGTPRSPNNMRISPFSSSKANTNNNCANEIPTSKSSLQKTNSKFANGGVGNKIASPRDQLLTDIQNHKRNSLTNGTSVSKCNGYSNGNVTNGVPKIKAPSQDLQTSKAVATGKASGVINLLDSMKCKIQALPSKRSNMNATRESLNSSQEWD